MKRVKIQLTLSKEDQTELNYQNPNLEWDFEYLMGKSWTVDVSDYDIIKAIRNDIGIPDAYLNSYRVLINQNILLVVP
jgi:hypothetical protein